MIILHTIIFPICESLTRFSCIAHKSLELEQVHGVSLLTWLAMLATAIVLTSPFFSLAEVCRYGTEFINKNV